VIGDARRLYEIKQTVDIDIEGERVALVGRKNITLKRSEAGNTLRSDDIIIAELAEARAAQG